jgi:hypothetical protein
LSCGCEEKLLWTVKKLLWDISCEKAESRLAELAVDKLL